MCGGAQNVLNQGFLPRYILASFAMEAKKNISKNQCIVNWIDYLVMFCCQNADVLIKGQIISKWFFDVFDFLQKTNENKLTWGIIVVKSNSFVCFLEEIEDAKNHFEIIL